LSRACLDNHRFIIIIIIIIVFRKFKKHAVLFFCAGDGAARRLFIQVGARARHCGTADDNSLHVLPAARLRDATAC
jgi:hypothetical protein